MTLRVESAVDTAAINAACDGVTALVDAGAGDGSLQLWSGSPPGTVTGAPAGTLLAEVDFTATAFAAASGGEAVANGLPLDTTGLATGTIGFVRVLDGDDNPLWDEDDVGVSGNAVTVNTLDVQASESVTLNGYTFTVTIP